MAELILDAGPLITACKFTVAGRLLVDYLLDCREIAVAESVRDEVVLAGTRYPDARAAHQRIESRQIAVLAPPEQPDIRALLQHYDLGVGERDTLLLGYHLTLPQATLVIDDHLAYLVSDRLGQRKRFLLDVVLDLADATELDRARAVEIVQMVRPRYPVAFIEHTLTLLRR